MDLRTTNLMSTWHWGQYFRKIVINFHSNKVFCFNCKFKKILTVMRQSIDGGWMAQISNIKASSQPTKSFTEEEKRLIERGFFFNITRSFILIY